MKTAMMTNEQIWKIAVEQSAVDCNCRPEDFFAEQGKVVPSVPDPKARKYLPLPFECDMTSYGNCIIAQTSRQLAPIAEKYIQMYPVAHAFETPNLHALDDMLRPFGMKVCFMAEYFLPDVNALEEIPCKYPTKILYPEDFSDLYLPQWSNALCEKRKQLDAIAVGAYDGETLIGLAGASADCENMYQISIDVLPAFRRQGIAAALTSRLALEIFKLGKVPFYCAAWCNLASVRNAVKCGFRPAWVEMTARSSEFVDAMNKGDEK